MIAIYLFQTSTCWLLPDVWWLLLCCQQRSLPCNLSGMRPIYANGCDCELRAKHKQADAGIDWVRPRQPEVSVSCRNLFLLLTEGIECTTFCQRYFIRRKKSTEIIYSLYNKNWLLVSLLSYLQPWIDKCLQSVLLISTSVRWWVRLRYKSSTHTCVSKHMPLPPRHTCRLTMSSSLEFALHFDEIDKIIFQNFAGCQITILLFKIV